MRATILVAALAAAPVAAQDFAEGSAASSWGLIGEQKARFEARVVDVLCELAGDCPEDCGGGGRYLGLLRAADGVLVMPLKNAQGVFSGPEVDLLPHCGTVIEVDGLMVGEAEVTPAPFYQVQTIRPAGADAAVKAEAFTEAWESAHPDLAGQDGPWFRRDPDVAARIEAEGHLGLGPEADAAFIAEWF